MDIKNDSSETILNFLKNKQIDTELSAYEESDLKLICDKIGLQRQGKVKLKKTFIKKITDFVKNLEEKDNNKYHILFSDVSLKRQVMEAIQDKIEENKQHGLVSVDYSSGEDLLPSPTDSNIIVDTSELKNINDLYIFLHENNNMVDHQEWSNFTKIINSGKTTLVNLLNVYSQFMDDSGNSIKLGMIAYIDNAESPLEDYINNKNCIIYQSFEYNEIEFIGCIFSGIVLEKSSYREFEINQSNQFIILTNNKKCNILNIDRCGIDFNLKRKSKYEEYKQFYFFVGKEWIDSDDGTIYMYDMFHNNDVHDCYVMSNSITKKNGFKHYKLCKFTLIKHKKSFKKIAR